MPKFTEPNYNIKKITIRDAHVRYRNFGGARYGRELTLQIDDPEIAQEMANDGWPVRTIIPDNPDYDPRYQMRVAISYRDREGHLFDENDTRLPHIYMCTRKRQHELNEDTIARLDRAELDKMDLTVRARWWKDENSGEWHIKAFLSRLYATICEDDLDAEYAEQEYPEE